MGLLDGTKGFFFGFAVGFGTGAIFRDAIPHFGKAIAPLLKVTLKSAVLVTEKSKEISTHFIETVQDIMAEVTEELRDTRRKAYNNRMKGRGARRPFKRQREESLASVTRRRGAAHGTQGRSAARTSNALETKVVPLPERRPVS